MITVGVIRSGATYLASHLRKNDYWAEGEKEVEGQWIGLSAEAMNLHGPVTAAPFEALRLNRHPETGEPLTPRDALERTAFFDIQLSAPKDVSVLAMVGGDERVKAAFVEAVHCALREMERYAAVRERRGDAATSEEFRLTGNYVGAVFFHDASRDLDPQLHAHAVLANVTYDPARRQWMALQPAEMLRASPYLRQVLYRELGSRLRALGYEVENMSAVGFNLKGLEHLRARFSKRSKQVEQLAQEFAKAKGRQPTKKEREILVRDSREQKLSEISTDLVRQQQRAQLTESETRDLQALITRARAQPLRPTTSVGNPREIIDSALRHVYERVSVAREGLIYATALSLHPHFNRWQELRPILENHPDALRSEGEVTLRSIRLEETRAVTRAQQGRNTRFPLGDASLLPTNLTQGQKQAAQALVESRDLVTVLIGDAGTGKTTVLRSVEACYEMKTQKKILALAPTTRARDGLAESGFRETDTVQRFLTLAEASPIALRRVILVDEAGLLSTSQLDRLTRIVDEQQGRLLLIGDPKQHYSVERGDALRHLVLRAGLPTVRLSEVLRQRTEADRRFSRMLADGATREAFAYADRRGMIEEITDENDLFRTAAVEAAAMRKTGVDTLVVIPFWSEIERFDAEVRPELRRHGLLGNEEIEREALRPLSWTQEEKAYWHKYEVGHRLLFVRATKDFKQGDAPEVFAIVSDGLWVRLAEREFKIRKRQIQSYEVSEVRRLKIAQGDRVLIRGQRIEDGLANGDVKVVAEVNAQENTVRFEDGSLLAPDFSAWTYGHALTAYRSQGATSEASLLVLGSTASVALEHRQFYVGSTRYRGSHKIYVADKMAILGRITRGRQDRELATEFVDRRRLSARERILPRPVRRWRNTLRRAWRAMVDRLRSGHKIQQRQTQ